MTLVGVSSHYSSPGPMMPTAFAMALAVMGWSPVTMMTFMPAERHFSTASGTLDRGGSMREMRPTKQRFSRGKFTCGWGEGQR